MAETSTPEVALSRLSGKIKDTDRDLLKSKIESIQGGVSYCNIGWVLTEYVSLMNMNRIYPLFGTGQPNEQLSDLIRSVDHSISNGLRKECQCFVVETAGDVGTAKSLHE